MTDRENLLQLSGMRMEDILKMRPCDIDRNQSPWEYRVPDTNRIVMLGSASQKLLTPLLEAALEQDKPLFSVA